MADPLWFGHANISSRNICTENGLIVLRDLPVQEGDSLEVIVTARSPASSTREDFPLRGEPMEYHDPFEPVAGNDWEATR